MTRDPQKNISRFAEQVRLDKARPGTGELRLGVDLGTANIVLSVVDEKNNAVTGAWHRATVVRDGIVVDWVGAVQAVRELKSQVEARLGRRFTSASVAVPPGINAGTTKVFTNVLEASGLESAEVVDEPVAAAHALGVRDGCVIDVGHGTTGVSILADGKVISSIDEPTGGHHMTLVLAGAYHIDYDEAERLKIADSAAPEIFGCIRPTLEKMATIAARAITGHDVGAVYLVGGASSMPGAPGVFEDILHLKVHHPDDPLFVTPLGIAMTAPQQSLDPTRSPKEVFSEAQEEVLS